MLMALQVRVSQPFTASPSPPMKRSLSSCSGSSTAGESCYNYRPSGCRSLKSPEERKLRRNLGARLRAYDEDLVHGYFHDEEKFLKEEFHQVADPVIHAVIGSLYKPPNLPIICFNLCCDIAKKRRRYLTDGGKHHAIDLSESAPAPAPADDSMNVSSGGDDDNVSDYFEHSNDSTHDEVDNDVQQINSAAASYRTKSRTKIISRKAQAAAAAEKKKKQAAAAAEKKRKQTAAEKNKSAATSATKKKPATTSAAKKKKQTAASATKKKQTAAAAEKKRKQTAASATKKKQTAASATKKKQTAATAKKKPTTTSATKKKQTAATTTAAKKKQTAAAISAGIASRTAASVKKKYDYQVWDKVLCAWTLEDGTTGHYPAEITKWKRVKRGNKVYEVYFTQDGMTREDVTNSDLKKPPADASWAKVRRPEFVTHTFSHNVTHENTPRKFGKYRVTLLGSGDHLNTYVCQFLPSGRNTMDDKIYYFDVGYVQQKLLKSIFPFM